MRLPTTTSLIDLLDRILDKGIVWHAFQKVASGIVITGRIVVTTPDDEEPLPTRLQQLERHLARIQRRHRRKYEIN